MEEWLYARNIMFSKQLFLHKECIGGLQTNLRGHAKTCLLITCSCKNFEKINKHAHLDGIQRCGWGTLAHLSWLHRFHVFFFWVLEICGRNFKNTEKVQSSFKFIYTLPICFDIQTTNKKKTKKLKKNEKSIEKPKKKQKRKKQKKNKALTETQTSPRIFVFFVFSFFSVLSVF